MSDPLSTSAAKLGLSISLGLSAMTAYALQPSQPLVTPAPIANDPVASPVAQGPIKRMLINPFGEIDGMRLADGTIVRFPAHLADDLVRIVKPGDTVRIIGRPEAAGIIKADAVINVASSQMIIDQPPAPGSARTLLPHLRAQGLQEQRVEGYVDTVLMGRRGETNGVILTDGSIARFPPDSLPAPIRQGEPFAAAGLGTRNTYGTSLEAISVGNKLSALQPLYNRVP